MECGFNIYIVGTKNRPTEFLTPSGEPTGFLQDAMYHMDRKDAEREIEKCDEPELFQIYEAKVTFEDL